MMKIAKKLLDMCPYEPVAGQFSVRLDANESPFALPVELKEKLAAVMTNEVFNRYPDPGSVRLRGAAATHYGVATDMVIAGNGSDEMISLILSSMLQKGSKIMLLAPDFSMYRFYADISELNVCTVKKNTGYVISVDEIMSAVRAEKPEMLVFSNPCNPTGAGISREEIEKLITGCPDCILVIDEAYMDFWDQTVTDIAVKAKNVIVLKTASKAYGLAAARIGFAIANPYLIALLNRARSPFNVNAISQAVGAVLLEETLHLTLLTEKIKANKRHLEAALLERVEKTPDWLTVHKTVTNFCAVYPKDPESLMEKMTSAGIAVRYFPSIGLLRVTAGTEEENRVFLSVFDRWLETR